MDVTPLCLELLHGEVHFPSCIQEDGHRESGMHVDEMEYRLLADLENEHEADRDTVVDGGRNLAGRCFASDQWCLCRFAKSALAHDGLQGFPKNWSKGSASLAKDQHVLQR